MPTLRYLVTNRSACGAIEEFLGVIFQIRKNVKVGIFTRELGRA